MMFADISKEAFTRKKNISQHQIISICQRTINIINYAQEGASLISKQGEVKKKKCIFVSTTRPHEQNGFRLSWKLCLNLCSHKWPNIQKDFKQKCYLTHVMILIFFNPWKHDSTLKIQKDSALMIQKDSTLKNWPHRSVF